MTCQYGNLKVKALETNLKGIKVSPKADGLASDGVRGPHDELHVVAEPTLNDWSKDARAYEGSYYAVLELKPTTTRSVAKVEKVQQGGLIGLRVACNNRTYTTHYNSGEESVPVSTAPYTTSRRSSVFPDRNTDTFARPFPVPATLSLPKRQGIIIVSGDDERLHQPGFIDWPASTEYFGKHPSSFGQPH